MVWMMYTVCGIQEEYVMEPNMALIYNSAYAEVLQINNRARNYRQRLAQSKSNINDYIIIKSGVFLLKSAPNWF